MGHRWEKEKVKIIIEKKWSNKRKRSIDCNNPKGFSEKAHCAGRKKNENLMEADPKKGTGKKPKGSGRRLYTDENPSDTVSVKFSTVQDIKDTLSKESFKSKSHKRQSQIINLIHQRVRVAKGRTKDPVKKKRLAAAFSYISKRKEASKRKTQRMKSESLTLEEIILEELDNVLTEKCWPGYEKKGMKTMFGKRYPNCVKKTKKKGKRRKKRKNEEIEEYDVTELLDLKEEEVEENLRDWFGKSKSKDGKKGWVQVVSGKPCARQPGQKTTPKCVSSAKRASMSKKERESAQRRKRAADPNQPKKSGAAKPTYVSTDKKKKKKVKKEAKANWYEPHM